MATEDAVFGTNRSSGVLGDEDATMLLILEEKKGCVEKIFARITEDAEIADREIDKYYIILF